MFLYKTSICMSYSSILNINISNLIKKRMRYIFLLLDIVGLDKDPLKGGSISEFLFRIEEGMSI